MELKQIISWKKIGEQKNRPLVSLLDRLNVARLDPSDAMENFQHHIDHLKTKGFRPVERMTK